MEKILKLYTYVDGVHDTPFPNEESQAEVAAFRSDYKRMGGAPSISCTIMHHLCLDKMWTYNVYATFNGEKFFIKQIPSSSFDNTNARYKHEVELVSERIVLDNVYFYDVVDEADYSKPVSNSTSFTFFGDIHEFAHRLNQSLKYSKVGYNVVVDDGISSEAKQVSFQDQVFSNVLQEAFNTYEIPYYFDGKTIHIGFTNNAITKTFKYGSDESLLSIQKQNANYKIVNRVTGVGSSDNIPYYYPNFDEKGVTRLLYNGEVGGVSVTNKTRYKKVKLGDTFVYDANPTITKELFNKKDYKLGYYSDLYTPEEEELEPGFTRFQVQFSYSFYLNEMQQVRLELNSLSDNSIRVDFTVVRQEGGYMEQFFDKNHFEGRLGQGTYNVLITWEFKDTMSPNAIQDWQMKEIIDRDFVAYGDTIKQGYVSWMYNNAPVRLYDYGMEVNVEPNDGDKITFERVSYLQPQESLMPSIYRETNGENRFYNALNNTYVSPQTGEYYHFNNPYINGKPKEHIVNFEDIKPTIKGMTNSNGLRIDMFTEFAYDLNDNDEFDEEGNYLHPYFFGKLRRMDGAYGFNLFDHAIEEGEMVISMTSGSCGSCEWIIGVSEDRQENIVQVDERGNLLRDANGNVIRSGSAQPQQNDTINNEVWIALKKDISTFGVVMPNANANYKPQSGDTFVILHIDLPQAYILDAENRLKEELIKYMATNNDEKFNFSISFSRIFFAENPDILAQLNENARLQIEYDGERYELYVSSYSYSMSDGNPLPEIRVELTDTITISQNAIQTAIDSVKQDIMSSVGSIDFLKMGLAYFLRKDVDDRSKGKISSDKAIEVGNYVSGASGAIIYKDAENGQTVAEFDKLYVRMKAYFETLEIINVNTIGGKQIISPAGSVKCIGVEETDNAYRCYFLAEQDGEKVQNRFLVNDQIYSQMFDAVEGTSQNVSTHYFWRLCIAKSKEPVTFENKSCHYIDLSKTDCDKDSDVPMVGDVLNQRGNRTDLDRMNFIEMSSVDAFSPNITLFHGVNSYSLDGKAYVSYGVDKSTNKAFMNVYGDMYVGDRQNGSYMRYTQENGLEISGTLSIGTKLGDTPLKDLIAASTPEGYQEFVDKVLGDINVLQDSLKETNADLNESVAALEEAYKTYTDEAKSDLQSAIDAVNEAKANISDVYDKVTADGLIDAAEKDAIRKAEELSNAAQALAEANVKAWADGVITEAEQNAIDTAQAALDAAKEELNDSIKGLQDQIDGAIESYFFQYDPTLGNYPASEWIANGTENAHLNDTFTNLTSGYSWRWSLDGTTYKWVEITDTATTKALALAGQAKDTADGKRRVFVDTPYPPYDKGDLWSRGSEYPLMICVKEKDKNGVYEASDFDYADNNAKLKEEMQDLVVETKDELNNAIGQAKNEAVNNANAYTDEGKKALQASIDAMESSKANLDDVYTRAQADGKISDSETKAINAAKEQADAAIALSELTIKAYADGIVDEEEAARIKQAQENLDAAKKYAEEQAQKAIDKANDNYGYLARALGTEVDGGLLLTSLIQMRDTDKNIMSGINGLTAKGDKSIATWWGGGMHDMFDYYDWDGAKWVAKKNIQIPSNVPSGVIRMDGTGYLAKGKFWWDESGKIYADPTALFLMFDVEDESASLSQTILAMRDKQTEFADMWEFKTDSNGRKYLLSKYPLVTQEGITMYSGVGTTVPSIYDGLPIDGVTIYWENGILKAQGGGSEGINEEQLENYLTTNNYAKKSDIPSLSGYATQTWVASQGYITGITSAMVTSALGFTPYNADNFTKAKIKSTLGISDWALAESKPSYTYAEIGGTPDLSVYALKTSLSSYQPLISTTNKLAYSLVSGTPTSLKNPTALTFGSKTYDGSEAKTINASDLGALTSHQTIYALKLQSGAFSADTYTPNSAAKTINIPTTTAHISESGNLYFTNARAVSALSSTLASYVTLGDNQTITGAKNFTGGLSVNGGSLIYNASEGYWKLEGNLLVTGGVSMYNSGNSDIPSGGGSIDYALSWSGFSSGSFDGSAAKTIYIPSKLSELTNDASYAKTSALSGYLPLSGGTVNGDLVVRNSYGGVALVHTEKGNKGILFYKGGSDWLVTNHNWAAEYTLYHSGNFNPSDYLPKSGGTLTGVLTLSSGYDTKLILDNTDNDSKYQYISFRQNGTEYGSLGTSFDDNLLWNQSYILHSKNYSSYALPLSGNTLNSAITGHIYFAYQKSVAFAASNGTVQGSYGMSDSFNPLWWNGNGTHEILHSSNYSSYALPLTGGTIKGDLVLASTNAARNIRFNTSAGSSWLFVNSGEWYVTNIGWGAEYKLLHSGNYSSYALPLTGGTMTGNISWNNDSHGIYFYNGCGIEKWQGYNPSLVAENGTDFSISNKTDRKINYLILHSGNYSSYALPLSGGNVGDGTKGTPLILTGNQTIVELQLKSSNGTNKGSCAWQDGYGVFIYNYTTSALLGIKDDGTPVYGNNTLIHSGNIGSQSVSYASSAGDADTLDGKHLASVNKTFDKIPYVGSDGVMEIGKYIDFHNTDNEANDYSTRMDCTGSYKNTVHLPSTSGTLALTTDNVASATKLQTARTIWGWNFDGSSDITSYMDAYVNVIRDVSGYYNFASDGSGNLQIGTTAVSHVISLSTEGASKGFHMLNNGNIGIGTTTPYYKLDVNGSIRANGNVLLEAANSTTGGGIAFWNASGWVNGTINAKNLILNYAGGNVGIGTINPSEKLSVDGAIRGRRVDVYGGEVTNKAKALRFLASDDSERASIYYKGNTEDGCLCIESVYSDISIACSTIGKGVNITRKVSIGANQELYSEQRAQFSVVTAADDAGMIWLGASGIKKWGLESRGSSDDYAFRIYSWQSNAHLFHMSHNGDVGIGITIPSAKLHVAGNILTSGSITMNSMRSMKNIINENGLSLEELSAIKPIRFTWKDGRDDRIHVGGIADDVMKVLPEVVFKGNDGVLSMDYASAAFVMAASLIQPMTEHERRIANLERENALLKEEIRNLKSA